MSTFSSKRKAPIAAQESEVKLPLRFSKREVEPVAFDLVPEKHIYSTKASEFPFIASIKSDSFRHICSAALVSKNILITASTCLDQHIKYVSIGVLEGTGKNSLLTIEKFVKYPMPRSEFPVRIGLVYVPLGQVTGTSVTIAENPYAKEYRAVGYDLDGAIDANNLEVVKLYKLIDVVDCGDKKQRCLFNIGAPVLNPKYELIGIVSRDIGCIDDPKKEPLVEVTLANKFKAWVAERILNEENGRHDPEAFRTSYSHSIYAHDKYRNYVVLFLICLSQYLVIV